MGFDERLIIKNIKNKTTKYIYKNKTNIDVDKTSKLRQDPSGDTISCITPIMHNSYLCLKKKKSLNIKIVGEYIHWNLFTTVDSASLTQQGGLTTAHSPWRTHHGGLTSVDSTQWTHHGGLTTVDSPQWIHHSGLTTVDSPQTTCAKNAPLVHLGYTTGAPWVHHGCTTAQYEKKECN